MRRALELATLGRGRVSPNPMVGCVIVHQGADEGNGHQAEPRIIGEGWHQQYGDWHAEVNAVRSVKPEDRQLLADATVYVTLEPCSHWGKTPPCADLLIENRVKQVICCNDDPNPLVAGQGFAKLRAAGIGVETGLLAELGQELNARFFTSLTKKRPYILLKWAETADGFIAGEGNQPVQITGGLSQRLVHRWRTEEDAIMVGTTTARTDNPRLNVRLRTGRNPIRVVIDKNLALPETLHLFDGSQPTLRYTLMQDGAIAQPDKVGLSTIPLDPHQSFLEQLLADLQERRIQSLLVEGGTKLLQSFLDAGLWDEMRVFRSPMILSKGVKSPVVQGRLIGREMVGQDELTTYKL